MEGESGWYDFKETVSSSTYPVTSSSNILQKKTKHMDLFLILVTIQCFFAMHNTKHVQTCKQFSWPEKSALENKLLAMFSLCLKLEKQFL